MDLSHSQGHQTPDIVINKIPLEGLELIPHDKQFQEEERILAILTKLTNQEESEKAEEIVARRERTALLVRSMFPNIGYMESFLYKTCNKLATRCVEKVDQMQLSILQELSTETKRISKTEDQSDEKSESLTENDTNRRRHLDKQEKIKKSREEYRRRKNREKQILKIPIDQVTLEERNMIAKIRAKRKERSEKKKMMYWKKTKEERQENNKKWSAAHRLKRKPKKIGIVKAGWSGNERFERRSSAKRMLIDAAVVSLPPRPQ